ncbi:MAG: restriction endonuclease subunit S [Ruminococcus sp.]|nr:restriction endonuclease subunit S [Ruminococcus sp.]
MALSKYKLGELIELCDERNEKEKYTLKDVKGISIQKIFIETKADMKDVSLKPYKLVKPDEYAYVTVTSRNGEKITLAHNDTNNTYVVSSSYIVFKIKRTDILDSDYLFIFFNRPEFDRYARFSSWGSARETFSWEEMCDIDIDLPPLSIQQKYVAIYKAMVANQQSYECGLEDLKLVCDAYIEKLRRNTPCHKIGTYLIESDKRNDSGLTVDSVRGLATSKEIIPTKSNMDGVSLSNYKLVPPRHIAYVPDTSRRADKVSMGYNNTNDTFLVSSISIVFGTDLSKLIPEYLMLFLTRTEFDRYARFNSWGSARETFNFEDMCDVEIPIPDIEIQRSVADIYKVYTERKQINEQLKAQIKNICPILIRGAINEGEI